MHDLWRKVVQETKLKTHSVLVAVLIDLLISSVKHDQSDDPGNKKWRFDAKGKPSRSTLIML